MKKLEKIFSRLKKQKYHSSRLPHLGGNHLNRKCYVKNVRSASKYNFNNILNNWCSSKFFQDRV